MASRTPRKKTASSNSRSSDSASSPNAAWRRNLLRAAVPFYLLAIIGLPAIAADGLVRLSPPALRWVAE